jgi:hypothetical protein
MFHASSLVMVVILGLAPPAPAADRPAEAADVGGDYACKGTNPDGQEYTGKVKIVKKGDVYQFGWVIGQERYSGVGIRDGNILSVSWVLQNGDTGIVVYKIGKDKRLVGRWAQQGGKAIYTETLIPE